MKRSISLLGLSLLLFGCGAPQTAVPTAGAEKRVPDVTVTLPAEKELAIAAPRPAGLKAAATVPGWTGPRVFGGAAEAEGVAQLGVSSAGQAFVSTGAAQGSAVTTSVRGFKADGTALPVAQGSGSGAATGLAVVEDASKQVWHVQQGSGTVEVSVFGSEMNEVSASSVTLPNGSAVNRDGFYQLERSGQGVALLAATPNSAGRADVVTLNHQGGELTTTTVAVPFPTDLKGFDASRVHKEFSAASDGTQYVAMAFPSNGCVSEGCYSRINVQQIKGGQVTWSRVWDTYQPVRLEDISANTTDVVLLLSAGGSQPDSLAASSQLTRVQNDGTMLEHYRVPLEGWRRDWAKGTPNERYQQLPNLRYVTTDNTGRIVVNNGNAVLSGTFAEALTSIYLLDAQPSPAVDRGTITGPVAFGGDYLYAVGTTKTGLGKPAQPPRAAGDAETGPAGAFLLPLDYQLNER
ncbi:hypothetical protein GCM10017783_00660 [Deinococcus piscis]|uniref:Lipoprotein n=1 Tax=Deinococcus piscis TaxID=394230 RepID=A0ABQ3JWB9_9DEIO|nr:hypothetical protein [Deinococcus piscis]GHF92719.1 hypothetical protein GCM10017783_00660 [Deinococcus piscis]